MYSGTRVSGADESPLVLGHGYELRCGSAGLRAPPWRIRERRRSTGLHQRCQYRAIHIRTLPVSADGLSPPDHDTDTPVADTYTGTSCTSALGYCRDRNSIP